MTFTVSGKLEGLNQYVDACRRNRYSGARMKREAQDICVLAIESAQTKARFLNPVTIHFWFYEQNRRRDVDNVSGFAHKVILDALTESGVIVDDSHRYVAGLVDHFREDRKNPRIEVVVEDAT